MIQLIKEFFSENGQGSSKRWIAISTGLVFLYTDIYSFVNSTTDSARFALIIANMMFLLILLGLATSAQILSIWKGITPKDDANPEKQELIEPQKDKI